MVQHKKYQAVQRKQHSDGILATIFRKKKPEEDPLRQMREELNENARQPPPPPTSSLPLLKELTKLRQQVAEQNSHMGQLLLELEDMSGKEEKLRQALHLERFKYEMLVDLWAMRVLDGEDALRQEHNASSSRY